MVKGEHYTKCGAHVTAIKLALGLCGGVASVSAWKALLCLFQNKADDSPGVDSKAKTEASSYSAWAQSPMNLTGGDW